MGKRRRTGLPLLARRRKKGISNRGNGASLPHVVERGKRGRGGPYLRR